MKHKIAQFKEFEILDSPKYPELVYKFRRWSDEYEKTVITEKKLYLAPPTSFKDKKDCKLLVRYDLMTNLDIYQKYLRDSKREHTHFTKEEHKRYALKWTTKSPFKDKKDIKRQQEEHFMEFDKRFGVLSLTANKSNIAMWNKYSNYGNGFCVGFNSAILFDQLGGGCEVKYYPKLPDIYHDDPFIIEHFKQVYSKEEKWSIEEEYRTHKFFEKPANLSDRLIVIPNDAFQEVIFGWNLTVQDKNEIIQYCNSQKLKVNFYNSYLHNNEIDIRYIE